MSEQSQGTALALRDRVLRVSRQGVRRVIAITGAPASGKSTMADILVRDLDNAGYVNASVVDLYATRWFSDTNKVGLVFH